ncbi:MAG: hypothetical protein V7681_01485 [Halopseudomonas sabulinigri]
MSAWDLTSIGLTLVFGVIALYIVGCHVLRFLLAYSPWPIAAGRALSDQPAIAPGFRAKRYLVVLLWHWTLPFMFGAVAASMVSLHGIQSSIELVDHSFDRTMQRMIASCTTEATETAEISEATRSLFPLARGPTSPPGALATHPRIPLL